MTLQPKGRLVDPRLLYFVNVERWHELKDLFEKEACELYNIDRTPLMKNVLQVGLSAVKTHRCGGKQLAGSIESTECPACDPLFKPLTKELRLA